MKYSMYLPETFQNRYPGDVKILFYFSCWDILKYRFVSQHCDIHNAHNLLLWIRSICGRLSNQTSIPVITFINKLKCLFWLKKKNILVQLLLAKFLYAHNGPNYTQFFCIMDDTYTRNLIFHGQCLPVWRWVSKFVYKTRKHLSLYLEAIQHTTVT